MGRRGLFLSISAAACEVDSDQSFGTGARITTGTGFLHLGTGT